MRLSENSKEYKKKWFDFRNKIIERDEDMCVRCGRSDGVFNVHHKRYISGRMPWEYHYELCETLCRGCHALEHGKILPKVGWEFLFEDDLGDLSGECDYCKTNIRYVFYIYHSNWDLIGVGTDCCDNLTGTELASSSMESKKRYSSRLIRFVKSRRWTYDDNGIYKIKQKGLAIEIKPALNGFKLHIDEIQGKNIFQTIEEAKEKTFEGIENGSIPEYVSKIKKTPT